MTRYHSMALIDERIRSPRAKDIITYLRGQKVNKANPMKKAKRGFEKLTTMLKGVKT